MSDQGRAASGQSDIERPGTVTDEGGWWPPGEGEPGCDWEYKATTLRLYFDGAGNIDVTQVLGDQERALVSIPVTALAAELTRVQPMSRDQHPEQSNIDLSLVDLGILGELFEHTAIGGITGRDLASTVGVPARSIGSRLTSLRKRGLVRGEQCAGTTTWFLTAAGEELCRS